MLGRNHIDWPVRNNEQPACPLSRIFYPARRSPLGILYSDKYVNFHVLDATGDSPKNALHDINMSPPSRLFNSLPLTMQATVPNLKVDGSNWLSWKALVNSTAAAEGWSEHLERDVIAPTVPPPYSRWDAARADSGAYYLFLLEKHRDTVIKPYTRALEHYRGRARLRHLILSSIPEHLVVKYDPIDSPSDIWDSIVDKFETKRERLRLKLQSQLRRYPACHPNRSVQGHIGGFIEIYRQCLCVGGSTDEKMPAKALFQSLPQDYQTSMAALMDNVDVDELAERALEIGYPSATEADVALDNGAALGGGG